MLRHALLPLVGTLTIASCGDGDSLGAADQDADGGTPDSGRDAASATSGDCSAQTGDCEDFGSQRPFRLSEHGAAYLEDRGQMLVFGGTNAVAEACNFPAPDYHAETWIFDEGCGKWQELEIDDGPSARARHSMTYGGGLAWMFGGRWGETDSTDGEFVAYSDLWTFDPDSRTWAEIVPDGASPPARANSSIAWDSKRELVWVWGGNVVVDGAFQAAADLWRYNPRKNRWIEVDPGAGGPGERLYHTLAYDRRRDQLIVYGGTDESFVPDQGLWGLDLDELTWSRLDASSNRQPDPRYWSAMVLDPDDDRLVMLGGHDNTNLGNRNDWWFFDLEAQTWARGGSGDTLNSMANDFCDFPPDFADVDLDVPERRHAHSMVWSKMCGRTLIFAGKTDCGATDDVWALDDDGFTQLERATEGEVCLRWRDDPSDCSNLCN